MQIDNNFMSMIESGIVDLDIENSKPPSAASEEWVFGAEARDLARMKVLSYE